MAFRPSDKQAYAARFPERVDALEEDDTYHVLLQGAMGSGKTEIGVRMWASWLAETLSNSRNICAFKDSRQGKFEIATMLYNWSLDTGLRVDLGSERWLVESFLGEPNIIVPMAYGQGGVKSAAKFRNWNLASIFVDESPEMDEQSRKTLLSRLRAHARPVAIWAYNPDDENNFKKSVHDPVDEKKMAGEVHIFKLLDNPGLPAGYRRHQEWTYPHEHERKRYIEGQWAAAGIYIWPGRAETWMEGSRGRVSHRPDESPAYLVAGIDWGSKSVTAAVLIGRFRDRCWVIDEYYHDAKEKGQLTADEHALEIYQQFTLHGSVSNWTLDATSGDLLVAFSSLAARLSLYTTVAASEAVTENSKPGIDHVTRFFNEDWLHIDPYCEHAIEDVDNYRWNIVDGAYGPVRQIKEDDHVADAIRYGMEAIGPLEDPPAMPVSFSAGVR